MAIPTQFDRDLSEIDDAASGILLQLRTMRHAHARDLPRSRAVLREKLQRYVDLAMTLADEACE